MTDPTPTELIADARRFATFKTFQYPGTDLVRKLADALEAQLAETARLQAELTRRDTMITELRERQTGLVRIVAAATPVPAKPAGSSSVEQFQEQIEAETAKSIKKGYTPEHDSEHGADYLLNWAIDYARQGKPAASANLIQAARRILASAGSSSALEAVKADTPAPPAFVNSVPNDGKYEYTSSSDCDGSNPYYRARVPARHAQAGPWFPISAEDYAAASKNWRGDWLPVETEGESR